MAKSVSLLVLRTRVRQRADIETATARHTDAELNDHVNGSIQELYDILRGAFSQSYYRAQQTYTTTAGTAVYALPNDFLALVSVDIYLGGSTSSAKYSATPYLESERNQYAGSFGSWSIYGCPVSYHLFGQNMTFIPVPAQAALVQVNYVPVASTLSLDSDTFDGVAGWEEYVVLDAACKALLKDESYEKIAVLEQRKAALRQRITDMATERDSGQPSRVNDVLFSGYGGSGFGNGGW